MRKIWVILRHRDVVRALHDQERFSATFYEHGPVGGSFLAMARGRGQACALNRPTQIHDLSDGLRPERLRRCSSLPECTCLATPGGYLEILAAERHERVRAEPFHADEVLVGVFFGEDDEGDE